MALTCPYCETLNRCNCKSCNPDTNPKDLVIIDYDNDCYQCYSCGSKFSEQESMDFEWERMHEDIKKQLTPEMCIKWRKLGYIFATLEQKKYEGENAYGRYGFESAFFQHFGVKWNNCTEDYLERIRIQIERENKINKLYKN